MIGPFWQKQDYELPAEPRDDSWAPLKAMPDGAHAVGAVKIALKNVVNKRRDRQGARCARKGGHACQPALQRDLKVTRSLP